MEGWSMESENIANDAIYDTQYERIQQWSHGLLFLWFYRPKQRSINLLGTSLSARCYVYPLLNRQFYVAFTNFNNFTFSKLMTLYA